MPSGGHVECAANALFHVMFLRALRRGNETLGNRRHNATATVQEVQNTRRGVQRIGGNVDSVAKHDSPHKRAKTANDPDFAAQICLQKRGTENDASNPCAGLDFRSAPLISACYEHVSPRQHNRHKHTRFANGGKTVNRRALPPPPPYHNWQEDPDTTRTARFRADVASDGRLLSSRVVRVASNRDSQKAESSLSPYSYLSKTSTLVSSGS